MLKLVKPTHAEKPLMDRMAQLYSYDFSEFNDWALGLDGVYPPISCFEEM